LIKSLHILITFLLFGGSISYAQNTGTKGKNPPPANVELLNADKVIFDQRKGDAQRALGNVQVRHDNTLMYCDSAWIYQKRNVLFAFGHLHVKQGDSLNMYGDSLFYDGNTGYGKLRGHIRMVELDMSMETDSLEFVSKEGRGWYSTGGIIRSAKNKNVLTSKFGEYRSASKDIFFSGEVMLKHPDYTMTCDTLRYHTPTETAWFYGPTVLRTNDGVILCEGGWYNTRKDQSRFIKNVYMSNGEYKFRGDTLDYSQKSGLGTARGFFSLYDTTNKSTLSGKYGWFNEKLKSAFVTDSALMMRPFDDDTLYLHADTLFASREGKDSTQWMRAWRNVRFFRNDVQGMCDTLDYHEKDSVLNLLGKPVIWQDDQQLSAQRMEVHFRNKELHRIDLIGNCFISSFADSLCYNQIKGRTMHGYFKDEKLSHISIKGNGQTIYYAGEKGKPLIGMNKAECSDIDIYVEENKISNIVFHTEPTATFFPMTKINPKDRFLKDFEWMGDRRPKKVEDLF